MDRLDTVDWASLEAAMGTAEKVPVLVRRLLEPKKQARRFARQQLEDLLLHQGGAIHPATVEVVPFLLELALDDATPDRGPLLVLLADLVTGDHENHLAGGYDPETSALAAMLGDHDLLRQLEEAANSLIPLLNHRDGSLRAGAAMLLAFLPRVAERSHPALVARAAKERKKATLASVLLATGLTGRAIEARPDLTPYLAHPQALVQQSAGIAMAWLGVEGDAFVSPVLGAASSRETVEDLPWADGVVARLGAAVIRVVVRGMTVDTVREQLGLVTDRFALAAAALDASFPDGERVERPRTLEALDPRQRALLDVLVEVDVLPSWHLRIHGLPAYEAGLNTLLAAERPVDRLRAEGEPWWLAFFDVFFQDASTERLVEDLLALDEDVRLELVLDGLRTYVVNKPWMADVAWYGLTVQTWRVIAQGAFPGDAAQRFVDAVLEQVSSEEPSDGRGPWPESVVALMLLGDRGSIDPRYDRLLWEAVKATGTKAGTVDHVRALLRSVPVERRAAAMRGHRLAMPSQNPENNRNAWHLWMYLDLCPTPEAVEQVVAYIERWGEQSRVSWVQRVLEAMPGLAVPVLRARVADGAPGSAVMERMLDAL